MNTTKKITFLVFAFFSIFELSASAGTSNTDSLIGRPFKEFSITAFCAYRSFHPSQYIADNNWDILCVFREAGPVSTLDSLNIPYTKSQLRLLMVGDLLSFSDGELKTKMPIFDRTQTSDIRKDSKAFADSIFPIIEPRIRELISAFQQQGYGSQTFSLVFSYLLDNYIWSEGNLTSPSDMASHGTWSGAYWAMYDKRKDERAGTNGYGPLKVTWTDELGYWPSDKLMLGYANYIRNNGVVVKDDDLKEQLLKWNIVNSDGHPTIPVIKKNNQDEIDRLCVEITATISNAVKLHSTSVTSKFGIPTCDEAEVIFYHEVMWDLLSLMESNGIIDRPAILKGEETGKEHFSDISFIVI